MSIQSKSEIRVSDPEFIIKNRLFVQILLVRSIFKPIGYTTCCRFPALFR